MPRVPIATENRTNEGGDRFPRIKLTNKGDKTRFTLIEVPWREYVHYLKHPKFDGQGRPVMTKRNKRNGEEYEDYDLEFLGSPICLGDEAVLREKGLDPKNCPACEAAEKSGGDIPGPIQRFAVNVIEYSLKGNTWDIKAPFSADIKIWAFTGRIYDEIEGIQGEIGDLRQHDLALECEDPFWQRNKLSFKMEAGYRSGDKSYVKELLTTPGNKATDQQLKDACGRDTPRARMQDDCDHTLRQWRRLRNEGQETGYATSGATDLAGGIDDLLGEETPGAAAPAGGNALSGDGADPFADLAGEAEPEPTPAAKKPARRAPRKAAASGTAGSSTEPEPAPTSGSASQTDTAALHSELEDDPFPGEEPAAAPAAKQAKAAESVADDFDFDALMAGIE